MITGAAGLIGSEASRFLAAKGFEIIGIDNDLRSYFFGAEASTKPNLQVLIDELVKFKHFNIDIRDQPGVDKIFADYNTSIKIVIHAAGQPSHDWAATDPPTDFQVNAVGTLNLLEATRKHCPKSTFLFLSTNKVYGDRPNDLPLVDQETRFDLDVEHRFAEYGIDESMPIDQTTHSIFGCSKTAADLLVQEYGRYFDLKTGVFRGGCLTGPAHSGAQLHGFLSYLTRCAIEEIPYTIIGHRGKQVRDNIHSHDLVHMLWEFAQSPRSGEVYNAGGGRFSHCSIWKRSQSVKI